MTRYILPLIITISLLAGACSGRKSKAAHRGIIPETQLITILAEVYMADGLLSLPYINYLYSDRDSLSTYTDIIEKHGYSKEMMDQTMRFYFMKRPKKLIKIYDKVLGRLSEMESRVDRELPYPGAFEGNLWQGKTSYYFPDHTGSDTAWFETPISYPGTFYFRFTLTIYPDDQTTRPRAGIFFHTNDTTGSEKRTYVSTFPYLKDGRPHTYDVIIPLGRTVPVTLSGWFIDLENQSPFREFHYRVDNIILSRTMIR